MNIATLFRIVEVDLQIQNVRKTSPRFLLEHLPARRLFSGWGGSPPSRSIFYWNTVSVLLFAFLRESSYSRTIPSFLSFCSNMPIEICHYTISFTFILLEHWNRKRGNWEWFCYNWIPEETQTGVQNRCSNSPYSIGTTQDSIGTVPHSIGTVPHSIGTVPHSIGTAQHSIGTVPHSIGTARNTAISCLKTYFLVRSEMHESVGRRNVVGLGFCGRRDLLRVEKMSFRIHFCVPCIEIFRIT